MKTSFCKKYKDTVMINEKYLEYIVFWPCKIKFVEKKLKTKICHENIDNIPVIIIH